MIKDILMKRDGMSEGAAKELIDEAVETMACYIAAGEMDAAENVCNEFFGLESDYLMELL